MSEREEAYALFSEYIVPVSPLQKIAGNLGIGRLITANLVFILCRCIRDRQQNASQYMLAYQGTIGS
jgi:hypothetical protein